MRCARRTCEHPKVQRGPKLKVLLVEDDAQVAELVDAMLGELGHEVIRGEHAARAGVPDPFTFGMTYPADNKQLLINTLRWLARVL